MDASGWQQLHHTISLSSLPPIISATTHKPLRLGQRINKPQTGTHLPKPNQTTHPARKLDWKSNTTKVTPRSRGDARTDPPPSTGTRGRGNPLRTPPLPSIRFVYHCCCPFLVVAKGRFGLGVGLLLQASGKKQRLQQTESVAGGKRRGPLQIRDLVDGGIIAPGRQNVAVFYKGLSYKADLEEDGSIVYEGSVRGKGGGSWEWVVM